MNLDPAAEYFDYTPMVDIRELIHIDDVMEEKELNYGPNGGLIFCMECVIFFFHLMHTFCFVIRLLFKLQNKNFL